jgi:hypothetical protein
MPTLGVHRKQFEFSHQHMNNKYENMNDQMDVLGVDEAIYWNQMFCIQ